MTKTAYVARRKGMFDWLDVDTISVSLELAQEKAKDMDEHLPEWSKDFPVLGFSRVEITEIERIES